jgi:hypothetical protein
VARIFIASTPPRRIAAIVAIGYGVLERLRVEVLANLKDRLEYY